MSAARTFSDVSGHDAERVDVQWWSGGRDINTSSADINVAFVLYRQCQESCEKCPGR